MSLASLDIVWVIVSAALVFMMQAGFLCLETGLTRSKNNINVALKNLTDFSLSILMFWMVGYGVMFGTSFRGLFGYTQLFPELYSDLSLSTFFVFQAMFCGTAVTILSGATAERMRFIGYIIISILISGFVYPVVGHWILGGFTTGEVTGWLGRLGFVDFAGATYVHSVGGWAGLAILLVVGPRHGRFTREGEAKSITGSNIPISTLGVLLLWVGWLGFNGGSNLAIDTTLGRVLINTLLGGSAGLCAGLIASAFDKQTSAVTYLINGILAGLVAVTGNAHVITSGAAVIIGIIGAFIAFALSHLLVRWQIDDAVDAVPVHLGAGIWSTISLALFADLNLLGTGLPRLEQLGVQIIGVTAISLFVFVFVFVVIYFFDKVVGFRVSVQAELEGLNISEHKATTEMYDFFNLLSEQAATNDLSLRMPVEPFTEVGRIAKQYNELMSSLQSAQEREQGLIKRLQTTLAKEAKLSKLQTDVINTISHEFLTPLSIINNASTILGRYHDRLTDDKREQHINNVLDQVRLMTQQLDQVFEMSNLRPTIQTDRDTLQYADLCAQIDQFFIEVFPNSTVAYTFDRNETSELLVKKDIVLLILQHLVGNSVKFSSQDSIISVHTSLIDGILELTVADTGIGVLLDERAKIFDLFYRGSNVESRRGLGLGLYLVQTYVTEQEGTVSAESNIPDGTIITVRLPVSRALIETEVAPEATNDFTRPTLVY